MPATPDGFQLMDGDLEIVRFAHELRHATLDHLAAVCRRSYTRVHKRVEKLTQRRYLVCLTRRPQKHIYGVGSAGAALLVQNGLAPRELAEKRIRHSELKEIYIRHTLFVTSIHVRLILLTRDSPIELVYWDEGPPLWDSVTTRDETGRTVVIPVRPDARFTLKHTEMPDGRNRFNFFAEADRATMSHERMREKVRGYIAYFQQQKHTKKYSGMKLFQVATITKTKPRAKELVDTFRGMMEPAWLLSYPVIPFEQLTLEALVRTAP